MIYSIWVEKVRKETGYKQRMIQSWNILGEKLSFNPKKSRGELSAKWVIKEENYLGAREGTRNFGYIGLLLSFVGKLFADVILDDQ